jgi:hypothetical protein
MIIWSIMVVIEEQREERGDMQVRVKLVVTHQVAIPRIELTKNVTGPVRTKRSSISPCGGVCHDITHFVGWPRVSQRRRHTATSR